MIRWIFFLLLIYLCYKAWKYIKRMLEGTGEKTFDKFTYKHESVPAELVQDPECGVYFVKDKAIRVNRDGKELYFCSEACKNAYMKRMKEEVEE